MQNNNQLNNEYKSLKVTLGLIVGYIVAGTINKFYSDITWSEALSSKELIFSFAGIITSLLIILYLTKKSIDS